jgi:superfamily II DNA or RNA helicase
MTLQAFIKQKGYYIDKESIDSKVLQSIKDELTVEPKLLDFGPDNKDDNNDDNENNKYKLYTNTKKYIIVPRYYGQEKYGLQNIKIDPIPININFSGQLRDYQIPIVNLILDHLKKEGGGLLSVPCGRGKTSMAIYAACELKVKTFVVVHKSFLLDQWVASIKKFTNARVGTIRGKIIDIEDKDIVIGMIQSLSMKEYDDDIFKQFNFVIYDEAHHCASKVFSRSLMKLGGMYTLALSATPYRGDGLIKVMHWFLGKTIYKENVRINNQVVAKVYNYKSSNANFVEKKFGYGKQKGRPNIIKMLSNLVELDERTNNIINIINEIRKDPERKIIVLSERVQHLKTMKEKLDKLITKDIKDGKMLEGEIHTHFYIGEMKKKEREIAEKEGDVLFATFAMAKEGLDIERLNTVILATSQKDVIQSVGRAMRKILSDGDLRPLIIDFSDYLSAFISHIKKRKAFYKQSQFIIEDYYIMDKDFVDKDFEEKQTISFVDTLQVAKVTYEEIKEGEEGEEGEEDNNVNCINNNISDSDSDNNDNVNTKKKKPVIKKSDFSKRLKF